MDTRLGPAAFAHRASARGLAQDLPAECHHVHLVRATGLAVPARIEADFDREVFGGEAAGARVLPATIDDDLSQKWNGALSPHDRGARVRRAHA